ncbi:MAG: hypothetical protein IKB97_09325 [Bacteroidaceae bacterium]|nr:hypothetical protein [Bacteroidaceae bacterium]
MDITGIDIGVFMTGIVAVLKSLHSDRKTDSAKKNLDERIAVLENDLKHHDKRLDDGDSNFKILDQKIDRNNELLNQLIGEIRAGKK